MSITILSQKGVLGRIAAQIAAADSNIIQLTMTDEAMEIGTINLTIQVEDRTHLARVIRSIRQVAQVQKIVRIKGHTHN